MTQFNLNKDRCILIACLKMIIDKINMINPATEQSEALINRAKQRAKRAIQKTIEQSEIHNSIERSKIKNSTFRNHKSEFNNQNSELINHQYDQKI